MIAMPTIESQVKSRRNAYFEPRRGACVTCGDHLCGKHLGVFFMEQRFTCANHTDEEVILDQIGWNNFDCPKCGCDYSIGRKLVISEPKPFIK